MTFTGEQTGRRIQSDPAGTGQIDLAPRVQIGEIGARAARTINGFHVRRQLNEITRHEARRKPQMPHQLHQQPARVAARAGLERERLLGRLHARFHADQIADVLVEHRIDVDEEVNRAPLALVDFLEVLIDQRRHRRGDQVGREFSLGVVRVGEREFLGGGFKEKIERVVDGHLGDHVDGYLEFTRLFGKHQSRHVVGERVLLPIAEMVRRFDALAVRQDARAAMWCRAKTHYLRA